MFNFLKALITGRISHETFMRYASDMFMHDLMRDHAPDDLNAIAIKANPDYWQKEIMEELNSKYKKISEHGSLNEQKLALRSATLDNYDMFVFLNMTLEQNETDLICLGKNLTESVVLEDVMTTLLGMRTLSYYTGLSYLLASERLGDKGDWLDAYKPAIELATKLIIEVMLHRGSSTEYLAKMAKVAADDRKMLIIRGKYNFPKKIPESNMLENTP